MHDPMLCDTCTYHHDHPLFRFPTHLVHPEHGKPMVFDVRGLAMCPDENCRAIWHRGCDNAVSMIGSLP
jgi:hypothetical protein